MIAKEPDIALDEIDDQARSPSREPLIVLAGPFPPPMHGMAAVNNAVLNLLAGRTPLVINLARELVGPSSVSYTKKFIRASLGCLLIIKVPRRRAKTFYSSIDDGLGSLLTTLMALAARFRNYRIVLHHHSYKYLVRRMWYMSLLVRVAGRKATHVFLCNRMESAFRALYPSRFVALTCPNPVTDPQFIAHFERTPDPTPKQILTVGFISNLMFEKGIREFVEVLRQGTAQGFELRGVMAGAAMTPKVQAFLEAATQELGDRLDLLGSVHGTRKIAFFESIDVLLFPTQYPTEAFSLVLMEGLLAGCPLITYGRGCIPMLSHLATVRVLPPALDFPKAAVPILTEWSKTQDRLYALKAQAHRDGIDLHQAHQEARAALVNAIIGTSSASLRQPCYRSRTGEA